MRLIKIITFNPKSLLLRHDRATVTQYPEYIKNVRWLNTENSRRSRFDRILSICKGLTPLKWPRRVFQRWKRKRYRFWLCYKVYIYSGRRSGSGESKRRWVCVIILLVLHFMTHSSVSSPVHTVKLSIPVSTVLKSRAFMNIALPSQFTSWPSLCQTIS